MPNMSAITLLPRPWLRSSRVRSKKPDPQRATTALAHPKPSPTARSTRWFAERFGQSEASHSRSTVCRFFDSNGRAETRHPTSTTAGCPTARYPFRWGRRLSNSKLPPSDGGSSLSDSRTTRSDGGARLSRSQRRGSDPLALLAHSDGTPI